MVKRVQYGSLQIKAELYNLVDMEILPGTGISDKQFWSGMEKIIKDLGPLNQALLMKRDKIQKEIDQWYMNYPQLPFNITEYKKFLKKIGYLVPEEDDFVISVEKVDKEIANIAGPQLVVPLSNARFALNAANARWGSLYDALYGTDAIEESNGCERTKKFNMKRAGRVIEWVNKFLDKTVPLKGGLHADVIDYLITDENDIKALSATLKDGKTSILAESDKFIGYKEKDGLSSILMKNHNLHIELQIDRKHPIGKMNLSGVKDVVLEAAITTIQDCEDSVAAVDSEDKVTVYRNWLGLMKGNLEATFQKDGKLVTRKLSSNRKFIDKTGQELILNGRSLMLVRNVGNLMKTDAILDHEGNEIPESFLDAMVTTLCAIHDIKNQSLFKNSKTNSHYIVKPKLHGPEEAALTNELFEKVENALGLPRYTIKIGLMDEERRTTVNLKECIRQVKNRLVFINTGFLDRTGDEIHTSMEAGPFMPKDAIKAEPWILAYEDWNVDIGIECGLLGKAQIGKGMWAKPDEMAEMLETKKDHLLAGANCAWVPSPTAATLHATHYHSILVEKCQQELKKRYRANLDDILTPPLMLENTLSDEQIQAELDNNAQGILGYVVRWIDQGVGCSKVPDINNVGLMEDRATLRISSQHISNWLHHGICTKQQVLDTMKRMAKVVDDQNSHDTNYVKMASGFEGESFKAACELIFTGRMQPNGYTEPILHLHRRDVKKISG